MKKISFWGVGALVALGVTAYLLAGQISWADSIGGFGFSRIPGDGGGYSKVTDFRKAIGLDKSAVAVPGDVMPDILPDRPGRDSDRDRHADAVPDRIWDESPDCVANISGAGGDRRSGCQGPEGGDTGDSIPENRYTDGQSFTYDGPQPGILPDGGPVYDGVPDAVRNMHINRALEGGNDSHHDFGIVRDYSPDWINSDTYLARIGKKTSAGDEDPDGGRPFGNLGIRVGDPGGTRIRPHDHYSDTVRDHLKYGSGPGDEKDDSSPDLGGLGTKAGGGGGGGGCSMVAGQAADPASGLAYLLVLLTPAAVVAIRRLRRK
jgi:hypothetical protein